MITSNSRELMSPVAAEMPVFIGLGNHDDRNRFLSVFADDSISGDRQPVQEKQVLVLEYAPVRIIILDSLLYVNQVAGLLGKAQRQWLSDFLAGCDDRPTVLFVHHTLGDGDGDLLDIDRLYRLVRPHGKVKAIFYGHSHEYSIRRKRKMQLINIPAVGYNFRDSDPVGWLDAVFRPDGVDLTLYAIGGNTEGDGQTTQVNWSR